MRQLFSLFISFFVLTNIVSGQEIFGKAKNNFRNFSSKTTMVVLNTSDFTDLSIMDAVKTGWKISPYEFCTYSDFEKMKGDTSLYFLLRVEGKFKKEGEAKIEYLTLVKGGPKSSKGISKMFEIITLPLQAVDDESGKAFIFIASYIDIIQNHILNVSSEILKAYVGNSFYNDRIDNAGDKKIIFDKEEVAVDISPEELSKLFNNKAVVGDETAVEKAVMEGTPETVVGFVVSPVGDAAGSYSYKLIIDAQSHELLFFRRHRISSKRPKGFLMEDIKRISIPFRK
ncbi:MAG: hypothetical protein ACD_77C00358G0002 [uncultured bacterium]|nr:MAG: hypothetical protein ACD_77C00358G0002 [uncultured bacterium]HBY01628.1 hypothetical protein [Rikenellaceae bacterium]